MVVADSIYVGPCLIDAAVYDAFAIEPDIGWVNRLRIEREFQNIVRLHKLGRPRTR